MIPEGFDWQADDSVVVNYQPALAVYRNTMDSVVIRQERSELEDEDTIIIITPGNAQTIANAILRVAREIIEDDGPQREAERGQANRHDGHRAGIDGDGDAGLRQITDQRSPSPRASRTGQIDAFANGHASA